MYVYVGACRCDFSRTDSDAGATEVAPTLTGIKIVGNRLKPNRITSRAHQKSANQRDWRSASTVVTK
jgi:hypothetical protein